MHNGKILIIILACISVGSGKGGRGGGGRGGGFGRSSGSLGGRGISSSAGRIGGGIVISPSFSGGGYYTKMERMGNNVIYSSTYRNVPLVSSTVSRSFITITRPQYPVIIKDTKKIWIFRPEIQVTSVASVNAASIINLVLVTFFSSLFSFSV